MKLLSTSVDASLAVGSPELQQRVLQTRERASHELVPSSMLVGLLSAPGIVWVLWDEVPHDMLLAWLGARFLISAARLGHTWRFLHTGACTTRKSFNAFRALAAVDGLLWGTMGWAMTPVSHLDIAIVTISTCIGVAAIGAFMLQVDMPSTVLFIVPILLPNGIYATGRHDRLGLFCLIAIVGLMVLFIMEARRSNRRIIELLMLRFQSDDLTQAQAEALSQARILSKTKSRFVATMSHEMRTPLHGILGLVRLLRKRDNDPLSARQLDLIRSSGDHLVNVINDVLDFAKLEAGGLPVHHQRFNLNALLCEMAETANVTACDKGLEVLLESNMPRDAEVKGDPVRIRQILHNLLGNAIKFTQEGSVSLLLKHDEATGLVSFHIKDTGVGIPENELSKVFEAFHQAEGTYQRRFGGTGLGLTISRELARAMEGDITCSSKWGEGSVFTLTLPLTVLTEKEAPHERPAPLSALLVPVIQVREGHVPHVLLVEDNPVNALVAEAELRRLGLKVTVLNNGQQALDWLASQTTDLVLMDCEMPVMDGIEATKRIRALERASGKPPVRVVALTANGLETYVDRCVAAGMDDHLSKPFRSEELEHTLSRHIGLSLPRSDAGRWLAKA